MPSNAEWPHLERSPQGLAMLMRNKHTSLAKPLQEQKNAESTPAELVLTGPNNLLALRAGNPIAPRTEDWVTTRHIKQATPHPLPILQ